MASCFSSAIFNLLFLSYHIILSHTVVFTIITFVSHVMCCNVIHFPTGMNEVPLYVPISNMTLGCKIA